MMHRSSLRGGRGREIPRHVRLLFICRINSFNARGETHQKSATLRPFSPGVPSTKSGDDIGDATEPTNPSWNMSDQRELRREPRELEGPRPLPLPLLLKDLASSTSPAAETTGFGADADDI